MEWSLIYVMSMTVFWEVEEECWSLEKLESGGTVLQRTLMSITPNEISRYHCFVADARLQRAQEHSNSCLFCVYLMGNRYHPQS